MLDTLLSWAVKIYMWSNDKIMHHAVFLPWDKNIEGAREAQYQAKGGEEE